ncbi:MAG: hypothetical protein ACRDK5_03685 [Solirubrobacterales bacterium]
MTTRTEKAPTHLRAATRGWYEGVLGDHDLCGRPPGRRETPVYPPKRGRNSAPFGSLAGLEM